MLLSSSPMKTLKLLYVSSVVLIAVVMLEDTDPNTKSDKLSTLIKAAGVEDVESIWTTLFAKVGILLSDGRCYLYLRYGLTYDVGTRGKEC